MAVMLHYRSHHDLFLFVGYRLCGYGLGPFRLESCSPWRIAPMGLRPSTLNLKLA